MFVRSSKIAVTVTVTLLLLLLAIDVDVDAAPAKLESNDRPFALDLQPPLLDATPSSWATDSYGNPIETLKPIDTPDGRKVVSAQGLQFEIPNYASGITEIRKPADDLLPPHIDAIAVALPNTDTESYATDIDHDNDSSFAPPQAPATSLTPPIHSPSTTTTTSTSVEVEQAQLVPLVPSQQHQEESAQAPQLADGTLPDYILELQRQDADIAGPVAWTPAPNGAPLSVIAWDLLPPFKTDEPEIITEEQPHRHVQGIEDPVTHNIHVSLTSSNGLSPVPEVVVGPTTGRVTEVPLVRDGPEGHGTNAHVGGTTPKNNAGSGNGTGAGTGTGRFPNRHRGTAHYSTTSTTPRARITTTTSTPTTTTTTTTTTRRTTTTTRPTTTPRPSTSKRTTTVAPPTVSTTPLDPSTFYKLDNEEEYAYTLPPWLQEVTDPDLDVAVTFIVPTDNDKYNHSLATDLEPPFEPFVDLPNIQLTPPPTAETQSSSTAPTTTTTTTTTTTRRPTTTTRANRVRASSSTTKAPPSTTKAPISNTHNTNSNSKTNSNQVTQQQQQAQSNKFATTTTKTTTIHTDTLPAASTPVAQRPKPFATTPTTTTTSAIVEPNPFDSATVPPWLAEFDYADVGPGVPYNPDNFKDDALGTSNSGGTKPTDFQPKGFAHQTTASSLASDSATFTATTSQSNSPTTTTITASSSAFPSKVTLPLPSIDSDSEQLSTAEPPLVLIPPADQAVQLDQLDAIATSTSSQFPSTNSITPFAAHLEPQTAPTQPPRAVTEEQFPPFQLAGDAAPSKKFEFTKSDEGKVITTPFSSTASSGQRKDTQSNSLFDGPSTNSIGSSLVPSTATTPTFQQSPVPTAASPASNSGKYTGGFGAPSGLLRPQSDTKPDIYVAGNQHEFSHNVKVSKARPTTNPGQRYSGGFNAPVGVLAPQPQAPQPLGNEPRPFQQQQPRQHLVGAASSSSLATSHHQTRFGGPPGVLVPFDNVQRPAQQ